MNLKDLVKKMSKAPRKPCWFDNVVNDAARNELLELKRAFNAGELGHASKMDAYKAAKKKYPDQISVSAQTFAMWLRSGASE